MESEIAAMRPCDVRFAFDMRFAQSIPRQGHYDLEIYNERNENPLPLSVSSVFSVVNLL